MKICITILLAATSFTISLSQTAEELQLLRESCCSNGQTDNIIKQTGTHGGFVNMLFGVYKVFISSQDYHSCVFTPSCSEYAVQSIDKQGFIKGLFDALDRLTRCHGLRSGDYPLDPERNRLIDPVKDISYDEP